MTTHLKQRLITWLPLAITVSMIYGFVYLAIQQNIRIAANETPLTIAEDIRGRLEKGATPVQAVKALEDVDMKKSLSPFATVYNNAGAMIWSSALLDGRKAKIPMGILTTAKEKGINKITWEPAPGARNAIVVLPYTLDGIDGFVMAGQSMREVQNRIQAVAQQLLLGWMVTLVLSYSLSLAQPFFRKVL